jgi:hypothetical protein
MPVKNPENKGFSGLSLRQIRRIAAIMTQSY